MAVESAMMIPPEMFWTDGLDLFVTSAKIANKSAAAAIGHHMGTGMMNCPVVIVL